MEDGEDPVEAGVSMGLAVVFLLVGILIGFVLGTRGRQTLNAAKMVFTSNPFAALLSMPAKEEEEGKDEAEQMGGDDDKTADDILEEFMSRGIEHGLDDHPDLELNPVVMYQIKEAKAAKRVEMMRAALREEGLTEEEVEERMRSGVDGPGIVSSGKPSAFQVLIEAGARVTSVSSSSSDAALVQERKRQVRTIDVFLNKERGIDTAKDPTDKKQAKSVLDAKRAGEKPKSAFQVAVDSKDHGKDYQWLTSQMVGVAKRSRTQLRDQKPKIKYVYKKEKKHHEKEKKRGAVELNAQDLASIATEFEEGKFEEGEEGAERDADDPEALERELELQRIAGDISSDDEMFA